jgi:hypothetical protein
MLSAIFAQAFPESFLLPLIKKTLVVLSEKETCSHPHLRALMQEHKTKAISGMAILNGI